MSDLNVVTGATGYSGKYITRSWKMKSNGVRRQQPGTLRQAWCKDMFRAGAGYVFSPFGTMGIE